MNDMNITLATLHNYSAQEVFDYVCNHLLTQNEKSVENESCKYRTTSGLKCAAGCLISDEEYKEDKEDMEGYNWYSIVDYYGAPHEHEDLIRELQLIHDTKPTWHWGLELQELAEKEGLKFNYRMKD